MELEFLLSQLEQKDTSQAFAALNALEVLSDTSNILYPYLNKFISMGQSDRYVIRVRGFRLFCKQAKWDTKNLIDETLDGALSILHDPKPTAVRQALAALTDVVVYKKELHPILAERLYAVPLFQYKDTMQPLIQRDIQTLLENMGR